MKLYKVTFSNGWSTNFDWDGRDTDSLWQVWDIFSCQHDAKGEHIVKIEFICNL